MPIANNRPRETAMISSYVKVALRSMARHKTLSAINILGLSVGIAAKPARTFRPPITSRSTTR